MKVQPQLFGVVMGMGIKIISQLLHPEGQDGLAKAKRWRFFGGRLLLLGHCLDEDDDDMALEPQKKTAYITWLNGLLDVLLGGFKRFFEILP